MLKLILLPLALVLVAAPANPADAGWFRKRCRPAPTACCPRPASCAPIRSTPQAATPFDASATGGDGVAWVNAVRAQNGLPPIAHDASMASIAAANNGQQRARGMGHHVRGDRRQNAGMGDLGSIQAMWMVSPDHASAILDPGITAGAVVWDGTFATFSAY